MLSPEHKTHIEQRFDAFCKTVMEFEARNWYRAIKCKQKHEVSLNYLMEEYNFELPSMDGRFVIQSKQEPPTHFHVSGQIITVKMKGWWRLCCNCRKKSGHGYCSLFCRYQRYKDCGNVWDFPQNSQSSQHRALKRLRQEMKRLAYEET